MASSGKEKNKRSRLVQGINLRLRARLIAAFLLIALVPLTLLTIVVISQTQSTVTSMVSATLSDQAQRVADSMAESLQQLIYDLQNLAVNPSIEQLAVIRSHEHHAGSGPGRKTADENGRDMGGNQESGDNSRPGLSWRHGGRIPSASQLM